MNRFELCFWSSLQELLDWPAAVVVSRASALDKKQANIGNDIFRTFNFFPREIFIYQSIIILKESDGNCTSLWIYSRISIIIAMHAEHVCCTVVQLFCFKTAGIISDPWWRMMPDIYRLSCLVIEVTLTISLFLLQDRWRNLWSLVVHDTWYIPVELFGSRSYLNHLFSHCKLIAGVWALTWVTILWIVGGTVSCCSLSSLTCISGYIYRIEYTFEWATL